MRLHLLYRIFELQYLSLNRSDLLPDAGDLFLFGSREADIGREGIVDALDRSAQFFSKLFIHWIVQALAEFLNLLVKFAFGAGFASGKNKDARDYYHHASGYARYIEECKANCRCGRSDCARRYASSAYQQRLHDGFLQFF